jgi:hypothetical protein
MRASYSIQLEEIYKKREIPGNKYGIGSIARSQWASKAKRLVIRRRID